MDEFELAEALDEVLEKMEEVAKLLEHTGVVMEDPHFKAYVRCHLEGAERGWMGGPFLVDEIKKFYPEGMERS